jgi:O-antigen/teichoic acid export membrane protein
VSFAQFRTVVSGDFAAKALTAAVVVACVRWLPPAQLAEYVFVSALVALGATLFNGFFNRHYIVADVKLDAARSYRRWQVIASVLAFSTSALLLATERAPQTLLAGMCCTATAAMFDFSRTHAQRIGSFNRYVASELFRSTLLLALALPILLLADRHAVTALLAAQAGCYLVATWLLPTLPASGQERLHARALLADPGTLTLLAYFALLGVFGQLPMLILERIGTEFELAAFGSAMRYYGLALGVVVALNVVLLPKLAAEPEALGLRRLFHKTRSIQASALGLLATAALMGYLVIPMIDGGRYPEAPELFLILCSALVPGVVMAPLTNSLLKQRRWFELTASLLLANGVCAAVALLGPRLLGLSTPTGVAMSLPVAVAATLAYLVVASWCKK